MSAFPRASRLLDEVQHLEKLERFVATDFLAAAREAVEPPGATLAVLASQLDALRGLLTEIDRFAQKSMRIRLGGSSDVLPPQLRTLLHSTVLAYERDLPLLRARVAGALARLDPSNAGEVADRVIAMAETVLAARATLRQGVLELAQGVAAAWRPTAERAVRDRSQPDEERARWKRAHVDLERIAERGDALDAGSFAERLARIPTPDDPPEEERPDRFSLLELD
jgi:hypothetical protein